MEPFALVAITVVGLLVIIQLLRPGTAVRAIILILLICFFGPPLFQIATGKTTEFLSGPHSIWEFIAGGVIVLILLRILLNVLMPWRR